MIVCNNFSEAVAGCCNRKKKLRFLSYKGTDLMLIQGGLSGQGRGFVHIEIIDVLHKKKFIWRNFFYTVNKLLCDQMDHAVTYYAQS